MSKTVQKCPPWKALDLTPAQWEAARRTVLNHGPERIPNDQLAKQLGINEKTLRRWKQREGWEAALEWHRVDIQRIDADVVYRQLMHGVLNGDLEGKSQLGFLRLWYEVVGKVKSGVEVGVTVDNRSSDASLSIEEILSRRSGSSNGDGVDQVLRRAGRR